MLENTNTWGEILSQPSVWKEWAKSPQIAEAKAWIESLSISEVWFCGAGTSAFIGDILAAGLEGQTSFSLRAVPTTDIVSRPVVHLKGRRPLVVNFGRSGNSAETIGTLDALDRFLPRAPRLNITCNSDGQLNLRSSKGPQRVLLLPDETHDAGFAMTTSFSTMLLTALAVFNPTDTPLDLSAISEQLQKVLPTFTEVGRAAPMPKRAVFLGTGPLQFAAREAALKVLELTAGEVPVLWDSILGFRHGPKSFVTEGTNIYLFLSDDALAAKYEADLLTELKDQFPSEHILAIGPGGDIDVPAPFGDTANAPVLVTFAQVLSIVWSDLLGLNVDNPFEGQGTLTRVVASVKLHEPSE